MNTANWISSQVSRFLPHPIPAKSSAAALVVAAGAAPTAAPMAGSNTPSQPQPSPLRRNTQERLKGRVKKADEALSPRELRARLGVWAAEQFDPVR